MMQSLELLPISHVEVFRYLGMEETAADAAFHQRMQKCEGKLLQVARPRYTYCVLPLTATETELSAGNLSLSGTSIRTHLEGCERVILLAATLGLQVDTLIDRTQVTDMTDALILDALSNAAIEQICDRAEEQLHAALSAWHFTWRFSPGYGDFPLTTQPRLLETLNAARQLGVTATDSLLMCPKKSVTALIGCASVPIPKGRRGCAVCTMRQRCPYRMKGNHCQ